MTWENTGGPLIAAVVAVLLGAFITWVRTREIDRETITKMRDFDIIKYTEFKTKAEQHLDRVPGMEQEFRDHVTQAGMRDGKIGQVHSDILRVSTSMEQMGKDFKESIDKLADRVTEDLRSLNNRMDDVMDVAYGRALSEAAVARHEKRRRAQSK